MSRIIKPLTVLSIAIILFIAHLAGAWVLLGGHPFWSASATYFGLGAGLVIVILTSEKLGWGVFILLGLLTVLAFQTSSFGKVEFVGSYAENRFAGRIWYFGFIGFIAGLFASLTSLVFNLLSTKP